MKQQSFISPAEGSYDLICIGAALVDSLIKGFDPSPISASGFRAASGSLSVGGEAVNESMAAAKLGLKTAILCALGQDEAGGMVIGALSRCGVDTSRIVRPEDCATPVTTMFVKDDGTRQSITNAAHRYNFHPERLRLCAPGYDGQGYGLIPVMLRASKRSQSHMVVKGSCRDFNQVVSNRC
ncbi:MAG: carbohydrate kinase family protein, partial [Lachnospiraceae bacterium]|nr:carbohydrate kinase family protein [Lachnospiraceae bacterium]